MNFQLLKSFLAVAECKNFTRAAQFLNFTQPAISSHITTLEKLYGVTLFQRDGKNVYLTNAGESFRACAENMVAEYEQSLERMTVFSENRKNLRIAVSTQFINYFLMDVLYELHQKFPDLSIEVDRCMTVDAAIKETFTDKIYDLAFIHLDAQPLYTNRQMLWKQKIVWAASKELYEKHHGSDNLYEYPWVTYPLKTSAYYHALKDKIDFSQFNLVFVYNDSESVKLAVKKGLGIALLPAIKIKNEVDAGEMIIFSNAEGVELPISLLYQQNMEITPQMKYFFDLLNDYARDV